jgi:AAA+ ATPase superfamily predicted ATPase
MVDIDIETTIDAELKADLEISKHHVTSIGWKYYDLEDGLVWEKFDTEEVKKLSETELKAVNCLLKGLSNKEIKKKIKGLEGLELEKKAESFRKAIERVKCYLKFIFAFKPPLIAPCTQLREKPKASLDNDDIIEFLKSKQYSFLAGSQKAPLLNEPLFGREQLTESLADKVLKDKKSLLFLKGALGIGKKSLARAIALKIKATDDYQFHSIDFNGFSPSDGDAAYQHFIQKLLYLTSSPIDRAAISVAEMTEDAFFLQEKGIIINQLISAPQIIVLDDFEKFIHEGGDPFYFFFSEFLNEYTGSVFLINSIATLSFARDLEEKFSKLVFQKKVTGISFEAATEMLLSTGLKDESSLPQIIEAYSGHPGELRMIAKVIKTIYESSPDSFAKNILDGGSVFHSELYGYKKILGRCPTSAIQLLRALVESKKSAFSIQEVLIEFGASANTEVKILIDLSLLDMAESAGYADGKTIYRINRVVQRSLETYLNQT